MPHEGGLQLLVTQRERSRRLMGKTAGSPYALSLAASLGNTDKAEPA
jgi:hypothetical protein